MKITDCTVPSHMGMDQYLLIPFLVGWTSIYQLFWCSLGTRFWQTAIFGHAVHSRQVVLVMDFRVSPTVPTLTYRGFSRAEALRPGWHWMAKVQPLSCGSKVKHTIQDTPPSERHSKSFAVPDGRHVIWTSSEHVDVEQRPVSHSESKVCTRTQKSSTVRCWSKERVITILSRPFGFVGQLEGTISAVATYFTGCTAPPGKTPPEAQQMLNKEVCFFRPKKQVFLNKILFGVKAIMASKTVFENLFC